MTIPAPPVTEFAALNQSQRAAELQGRSLSGFIVASIQEAATRVIQEHETIRLAQRDRGKV